MDLTEKQEGKFQGNAKCEYNFTWDIANFSKDFDLLESEKFSLNPMCNSSWKILINFCSFTSTLQLGIRRMDESSHIVSVDCEFFLRNTKETLFVKRNLAKKFSPGQDILYCDEDFNKPNNERGVRNDYGFQFRLCNDDVLVVEGRIHIAPCCSQRNAAKDQNSDQLLSALNTSLTENIFTDVQILVSGEVINAHKFILASRSPVFKRMLETEMKENNDNQIEITDVDKSIFEMFLTFLYSGFIKECSCPMIMQLYTVADKYDVQSLFRNCSDILSSSISSTNACDILSLADFHNDTSLTEKAFQFLFDNFELVEPTEEWERFVRENTILAAKVVRKVASNIGAKREKIF